MRLSPRLAGVFLSAFLLLSWRAWERGLAAGHVDPVGRIAAQDEAVYSHSALQMARDGGWMTPRFLGRPALYKPPLLYWASGLSAKLLGPSALALRLPSLLAGAALATLLFAWVAGRRGAWAGLTAALLAVSNPVYFRLARMNLTDMLLALWSAAAMAVLARDPRLQRRAAAYWFGAFTGLAVMTKGIAGLLPLAALALMRPPLGRAARAAAALAAVALPWHLYQLAVNTRWFWTEYVAVEILGFGMGAPPQTSEESPALFYTARLLRMDPVLALLGLASLWWLFRARREPEARLLAAWLAVGVAAMLAFRYRNASYLLLLTAPIVVTAGLRLPRSAILAVVAAFVLRAGFNERAWGLPYRPDGVLASAAPLERYARAGRGRDLVIVAPDDEFYAALLPLPRVRYVFPGRSGQAARYSMPFRELGVVLSVAEVEDLAERMPVYRDRLRTFGVYTGEPVGTTIAASAAEIPRLVRALPQADFYLPAEFAPPGPDRDVSPGAAGRVFLLSRAAGRGD